MDEYKNNLRVATTSNVYSTRGSYAVQQRLRARLRDEDDRLPDPHRRAGEDLLDPVHRRPALHGDLQADRPVLRDRPLDPDEPRRSSASSRSPATRTTCTPTMQPISSASGRRPGPMTGAASRQRASSSPSSMSPMWSTRPRSTRSRLAMPVRIPQRSRTTRHSSSTRRRTCSLSRPGL